MCHTEYAHDRHDHLHLTANPPGSFFAGVSIAYPQLVTIPVPVVAVSVSATVQRQTTIIHADNYLAKLVGYDELVMAVARFCPHSDRCATAGKQGAGYSSGGHSDKRSYGNLGLAKAHLS